MAVIFSNKKMRKQYPINKQMIIVTWVAPLGRMIFVLVWEHLEVVFLYVV